MVFCYDFPESERSPRYLCEVIGLCKVSPSFALMDDMRILKEMLSSTTTWGISGLCIWSFFRSRPTLNPLKSFATLLCFAAFMPLTVVCVKLSHTQRFYKRNNNKWHEFMQNNLQPDLHTSCRECYNCSTRGLAITCLCNGWSLRGKRAHMLQTLNAGKGCSHTLILLLFFFALIIILRMIPVKHYLVSDENWILFSSLYAFVFVLIYALACLLLYFLLFLSIKAVHVHFSHFIAAYLTFDSECIYKIDEKIKGRLKTNNSSYNKHKKYECYIFLESRG